jgi:hypothetical protein
MEMLGVGLGLLNFGIGLFGASQQKGIDKEQVGLEYRSNLEDIRRRRFEQRQTIGATKALSETAGVLHTPGSTAQTYIDVMTGEFKQELDFMKFYAERAKKLGMRQAKLNFETGVFGAASAGLQTYAGFAK